MKSKKIIYKQFILITAFLLALLSFFEACDNDNSSGKPVIEYVRLTDPSSSDSAISSANMGQLIAIIGQHLDGAREIWFNDRMGFLSPTYTTENAILVNVPKGLPENRTDKFKLIFEDGYVLEYDFIVTIPPPSLTSIKCEFVPDGEIAVLLGEYFYEPITITFPPGIEAVIDSMGESIMKVVVPQGSTSGSIQIENSIGSSQSPFIFRDSRNILIDFDSFLHESWTASIAYVDSNPSEQAISGNYGILEWSDVTSWFWPANNELNIQALGEGVRGNIPLAVGLPSELELRFEINVPMPWVDIRMEIFFASYGSGHGRDVQLDGEYITSFCRWKPWSNGPFITSGWVTVSIPLSEFVFGHDDAPGAPVNSGSQPLTNLNGLTNITIMIFGPQESDLTTSHPLKICIDNIRIVPQQIE